METLDKMDLINTSIIIVKFERKFTLMELTQRKVKNPCQQNLLVWAYREEIGLWTLPPSHNKSHLETRFSALLG